MNFDWDQSKAAKNLAKHDVAFEEGITVFDDPYFIGLVDEEHSYNEARYWVIGESNQSRVLLTVYTERGEITWIISSRQATKNERGMYEEERYSQAR